MTFCASGDALHDAIQFLSLGRNIGHGCNAAVYALRVRDVEKPPSGVYECSERALFSRSPALHHYPLALKLMYNFALDMSPRLGDNYLWRSMGAELVPLPESAQLLHGKMGSFRPLPSSHPNVVRVLTAFIDRMPYLDDAKLLYPDALPTASFYDIVIDEPRTMFIVMKRDMKSDNILLEFNLPDEIPHLVISDFGCALATGSWCVKYIDDTIDLGGNMKMRAPEIVTASPSSDCIVDFRMADTWAAGALGYEIFTRVNPFYTRMSNATYKEVDLPSLPLGVSKPIRDVVYHLLRRNPREVRYMLVVLQAKAIFPSSEILSRSTECFAMLMKLTLLN
ncbi:unnamed protein product [Angiostrongylus costaricensis]|uniref:non-specific serine/threonine protein kinase n=1 Tax=Angiostrongylus costaricensis TaxID=334426 RepID=A0A158PDJ7_ANGCS|nr:unnamed protein product [Angiostrongylus costaricensis]